MATELSQLRTKPNETKICQDLTRGHSYLWNCERATASKSFEAKPEVDPGFMKGGWMFVRLAKNYILLFTPVQFPCTYFLFQCAYFNFLPDLGGWVAIQTTSPPLNLPLQTRVRDRIVQVHKYTSKLLGSTRASKRVWTLITFHCHLAQAYTCRIPLSFNCSSVLQLQLSA